MRDVEHRQTVGHLGIVRRERVSDHGADVVADDVHLAQSEASNERRDVCRHGLLVVALGGFAGGAHATEINRDHAVCSRELWHHFVIFPPGLGPTRQQDHRVALATGDIVDGDAIDTCGALHESWQGADKRCVVDSEFRGDRGGPGSRVLRRGGRGGARRNKQRRHQQMRERELHVHFAPSRGAASS
jgi:hypothetical protein